MKFYHLIIGVLGFVFFSCAHDEGDESSYLTENTGESSPGGANTVYNQTHLAFNKNNPNLSSVQLDAFFTGNSFFDKDWVIAPASTTARDGLGPFFNAKACGACHNKDGRGRPPRFDFEKSKGLLLRLSIPGAHPMTNAPLPDPNYGGQLQDQVIPGVTAEGEYFITYQTITGAFADGTKYELQQPIYNIINLGYGSLAPGVMISPRIAPQMIGLGLLEAIDQQDIEQLADPNDADNDGISGKPNYVWDKKKQERTIGRFGWKANEPNLRQQNADAFAGDIGITTSFNPNENCISGNCNDAENGGTPEVSETFLDDVELYSQSLAVPYRPLAGESKILKGKTLFYDLNCVACHNPSFTTGRHKISSLQNQNIFPYTDMLLHDMGPDLADNSPDFEASGSEWRTPPLWGIGLFDIVSGHTRYLHDGRARNIEEAILWHGGEAEDIKKAYTALKIEDRTLLIEFLNSL